MDPVKALALGLPVITMPSDYMAGRTTYVYYEQMNYFPLVVHSVSEYVTLALSITHQAKLRQLHVDEILSRVGVLFNCDGVPSSWAKFIAHVQKTNL